MMLLSPRLGPYIRRYRIGRYHVAAELGLTPPLIVASVHAPASNHPLDEYEFAFEELTTDLKALSLGLSNSARLVVAGDLNVPLGPNPPWVGNGGQTCERSGDIARAHIVLGALSPQNLIATTTFQSHGPTRIPWDKTSQDRGTVLDYIWCTAALKTLRVHPPNLPTNTVSDHLPLEVWVLAPKKDRRKRKQTFNTLVAKRDWQTRLPTQWKPADPNTHKDAMQQLQPPDIQTLTEQSVIIAKQFATYATTYQNDKQNLLKGLRNAPDAITRRAYQVCLRELQRKHRQQRETDQLQKWAAGKEWGFQKSRTPSAMRMPATLDEVEDRAQWPTLAANYLTKLYQAPQREKEEAWRVICALRKLAFQRNIGDITCSELEIKDLIWRLETKKLLDQTASQVKF